MPRVIAGEEYLSIEEGIEEIMRQLKCSRLEARIVIDEFKREHPECVREMPHA